MRGRRWNGDEQQADGQADAEGGNGVEHVDNLRAVPNYLNAAEVRYRYNARSPPLVLRYQRST